MKRYFYAVLALAVLSTSAMFSRLSLPPARGTAKIPGCPTLVYDVEIDGVPVETKRGPGRFFFLREATQAAIFALEPERQICERPKSVTITSRIATDQELLDLGWCEFDPCEKSECPRIDPNSMEWCEEEKAVQQ